MNNNPVNSTDSAAGKYFAEQNIRKAKQAVRQQQMSETERADMEQKLREAESASRSGRFFQAREKASEVLGTLQQDTFESSLPESPTVEPEVLKESGTDTGTKTYQDDSPDGSVSMQVPTELNVYQAPLAVRAHEGQHVRRERNKAMEEGKTVINTSVRYRYKIDGQGKRYLAGAQTIVRKRHPIDYQKLASLPKPRIEVKG